MTQRRRGTLDSLPVAVTPNDRIRGATLFVIFRVSLTFRIIQVVAWNNWDTTQRHSFGLPICIRHGIMPRSRWRSKIMHLKIVHFSGDCPFTLNILHLRFCTPLVKYFHSVVSLNILTCSTFYFLSSFATLEIKLTLVQRVHYAVWTNSMLLRLSFQPDIVCLCHNFVQNCTLHPPTSNEFVQIYQVYC